MNNYLKTAWSMTKENWKVGVGIVVFPTIAITLAALIFKLNNFVGKLIFPCEVTKYDLVFCTGANMFGIFATVVTIFLLIGYIVHKNG